MIFAVLIGRKGSEGFPEKIKEGIDVLNENPDYDSISEDLNTIIKKTS